MNYEEWVSAVKPNLGPDSAFRVKKSMSTTSHLMTLALKVKEEVRYAINELLKVSIKSTGNPVLLGFTIAGDICFSPLRF